MKKIIKESIQLLDILPYEDVVFANEFIKKLVLAWDPDYTKLTEYEEKQLNQPECCEFLSEEEAYKELGINVD